MKKILWGLLLGTIAGIIDVVPMLIQKLSWDANLSAFLMWLVIGFLFATTTLNLPSVIKAILIAFLVLTPAAIIIGWKNPITLVPIFVMTLLLSSLIGLIGGKLIRD